MRDLGHQVVDLIVERWTTLRDERPWLMAYREELEERLREPAPERGSDPQAVLRRAVEDVLPYAARVDHPRFFAYIPGGPSWPSVLADLLTAGFNTFQGTWLGSSGPSQVELVVLEWFREWLDMPEGSSGLFTSGGSAANLIAMIAAREACPGRDRGVVYIGDQGHSSVLKAALSAGIPRDRIRTLRSESDFRMTPESLDRAIREDLADGRVPMAVCTAAGATNTAAVDPLRDLGDVARGAGAWFHVDAAYGGFAILDPRGRAPFDGIGAADSVTLDPHKWFYQPFETGCLVVRDPETLRQAFRVSPEYLQDTELGSSQVNFGDRGFQLSRRFRALRVWMSVQMLGMEAFRSTIEESLDIADAGAEFIRSSDRLEFTAPPSLGVLCFRFLPDSVTGPDEVDGLNERIQEGIVGDGVAMMSSTRLEGRYSLRLAPMNYRSTRQDLLETLEAIVERGEILDRDQPAGRDETAEPGS